MFVFASFAIFIVILFVGLSPFRPFSTRLFRIFRLLAQIQFSPFCVLPFSFGKRNNSDIIVVAFVNITTRPRHQQLGKTS